MWALDTTYGVVAWLSRLNTTDTSPSPSLPYL